MLESKIYSAPAAPEFPKRNPRNALAHLVCLAVALLAARTCWRIERLYAEAGSLLPRRDSSEGGPETDEFFGDILPFAFSTGCFPLTLTLSLGEREQQAIDCCLADGCRANSLAGVTERRCTMLPLPGERVGVRGTACSMSCGHMSNWRISPFVPEAAYTGLLRTKSGDGIDQP